ncbi:MAG: hypothetical protein O2887_13560 [Bacteroidetes bacterium]|nr:hypothetical protein [Bacteroidota bacterium]MDA1121498.1 hypothetical protein [Bacteroidota bacterium]
MRFNFVKTFIFSAMGMVFLGSCGPNEDDPIPFEDAVAESFQNLTLEQVAELETPFEGLLSGIAPNGRVANHKIVPEDVAALIEELFNGSVVVEIEVDE